MQQINDNTIIESLKERLQNEEENYERLKDQFEKSSFIINSIRSTIMALTGENFSTINQAIANSASENVKAGVFSYNGVSSWKEKVLAYIKFRNKAVLTSEVVDTISDLEPGYTKKQIGNLISGTISVLISDGLLKKYKPIKMKGAYYANPKWFDGKDGLFDEYLPENIPKPLW